MSPFRTDSISKLVKKLSSTSAFSRMKSVYAKMNNENLKNLKENLPKDWRSGSAGI